MLSPAVKLSSETTKWDPRVVLASGMGAEMGLFGKKDQGEGPAQFNEEEWLRSQLGDANQLSGSQGGPIQKKGKSSYALVLLVLVLGVAFGGVVLFTQQSSGKRNSSDSDDLGQGIVNASGLRGHLVTRWLNGKAQYQLKIEPIDATADAGFAAVTGTPSGPIVINVRVLDSSGFALCGKEILVHFDPARAIAPSSAPASKDKVEDEQAALAKEFELKRAQADQHAREEGQDVFQNIEGKDGKVEALWAQGTIPCSPDQYRRFDYWDMSTNFPSLPEQQALLNHKAAPPKKTPAEEHAEAQRKAASIKPASAFYIEGDDRITEYESARTLLAASPGRSFFIDRKPDQVLVAQWAADFSLFHYKCDQHGVCALRHAGNGATVTGRINE